jgi:hypothetical protein
MSLLKCVGGILPLIALSMSACEAARPPAPPQVVTQIKEVRQEIPLGLLSCEAEPPAPAGLEAEDVERGANFVWDLAVAGDDCRAKVRAIRGLVTGTALKPVSLAPRKDRPPD